MGGSDRKAAWMLLATLPVLALMAPELAQAKGTHKAAKATKGVAATTGEPVHAGQLDVPLDKSQVVRVDRAFTKAMIGNPEIADIMPISDRSLYVLGKKMGTTSLTVYDGRGRIISVVDVAVGPDIVSLRRQMSELMPNEAIGARISNASIVLTGTVSSGVVSDKAAQLAASYAGDKVINLMSVGSSQQVMLEVRFSEINRQAAKELGFNHSFLSSGGRTIGSLGSAASPSIIATDGTMGRHHPRSASGDRA